MHHLSVFLVVAVLTCVSSCARTDMGMVVGGAGGVTETGGALAAGGMSGGGGTLGSGGATSTADLDACSSDADCTESCIWITAPTDSSQCNARWCCGLPFVSKKRCEANQAAWAAYCPNRSPTDGDCPCVVGMRAAQGGQSLRVAWVESATCCACHLSAVLVATCVVSGHRWLIWERRRRGGSRHRARRHNRNRWRSRKRRNSWHGGSQGR